MNSMTNRLQKNLKSRLKSLKKQDFKTNCFRLYEKDIPEYPFLIDIYDKVAIVYEKGKKAIDDEKRLQNQELIKESLLSLKELSLKEDTIIFKTRNSQAGKHQYQKLSSNQDCFVVFEGPAKFWVNPQDYLDVGLFLDHRPLRERIFKEAKDKNVLNLFSYTGSISVMAALAGAKSVTSVDMSKTYQEWAKDNFALNQLSSNRYQFITKNTFDFLKEYQGPQFDLIILDPPTFSNSKRMEESFEVERDSEHLLYQVLKVLHPQGHLYFSTNKRTYKLPDSIKNDKNLSIKDISLSTIPFDFRDKKIHSCFQLSKI